MRKSWYRNSPIVDATQERFQPNVPTLRAPERLQLKLHDAAIELTWFWQPWQPGQPTWPLRSVRFEVRVSKSHYNDFSCVVPESSWLKGLIHGISRGLQYGQFGGADVTPCRFNNSQMESGAAYGFAPFSVRPAARWSSDVWSTPGPAARPMLSKPGPVQR